VSLRIYSYLSGWEWHILQQTTPEEMIKHFPEAAEWILHIQQNSNHAILISQLDSKEVIVQGSLSIQLSEDNDDIHPLHFWFSKTRLITIHQDNRIPVRLQSINHTAAYEHCKSAPEAFCVMINILLEYFHVGLDHFQTRLGELESKVRMHNRSDLLDEIIERRYELLHYSHLYLPYREFEGIIKEAFFEQLEHTKGFIRMQHRFERLDTLLKHYSIEIDTLLSVDDAISSMRGNEIIRTLTIFTVLCLPATILGAIWGSNFEWLPFKDEPYGFLVLILTIFIITAILSLFLWKKGWTGDIISTTKASNKRKQKKEPLMLTLMQSPEQQSEESIVKELPPRKLRKKSKAMQNQLEMVAINHELEDQLPSRTKKHK